MSDEKIYSQIRDKLENYTPPTDPNAWDSFKKLLPAPWYMQLFTNYGSWLLGGIASMAFLTSLYYNQKQNDLLNGEISTLKNQIENTISTTDTLFVNQYNTDTLYLTKVIEKYIPFIPTNEKGLALDANSPFEDILAGNSETPIHSSSDMEQASPQITESDNSVSENVLLDTLPETSSDNSNSEINILKEEFIIASERSTSTETTLLSGESSSLSQKTLLEELHTEETDLSIDSLLSEEPIAIEEETPERDLPEEKQKKKINWPKMRIGVSSDYLGFNALLHGPSTEVFLLDKLSVSTGILFSGQIETKHPSFGDFNRFTGKQFDEEFKPFVPEDRPERIEDISIKTSFIKMPIGLNYYINTWSRFSFMLSAGTKLDLSVYQDVNYFSETLGQQIKTNFEARPEPKVFNDFYYGMGLQYKYKGFVGQISPYFDFKFRKSDYFQPPRNAGIKASLKFQFGG